MDYALSRTARNYRAWGNTSGQGETVSTYEKRISAYGENASGQGENTSVPDEKHTSGQGKMLPEQGVSVRLNDSDVLTAGKDGFMNVGGIRVAVPEELRDAVRQAVETASAYNQAIAMRNDIIRNQQAAKQQSKAVKEQADSLKKALEIFRRIASGGRVPPQDEKFLMEYSQTMYMAAKMEAMTAKEHEKYDTLLEDEEEDTDSGEEVQEDGTVYHAEATVSGGETPSVESVGVSASVPEISMDV